MSLRVCLKDPFQCSLCFPNLFIRMGQKKETDWYPMQIIYQECRKAELSDIFENTLCINELYSILPGIPNSRARPHGETRNSCFFFSHALVQDNRAAKESIFPREITPSSGEKGNVIRL
ncbi:hypothetical protein CEXT_463111 [Caerostris extrusa]|uniref:Uncharacterized protein n=1 Tax=Caerostris extrusa TaxID=172846 RepID=A0AAV4T5N6_CAEEX|nr:hypothetical protein CEXT_463111 [Caerostris extrusa]